MSSVKIKMDMESSNLTSPVLTEASTIRKSVLGVHPTLLSFTSTRKLGKFDDARSNRWLDSMRSSSPPRKKILKDSDADALDRSYRLWQVKYPSALASFEQLESCASNKKIVLFLDYDGTLSPIVNDPDDALMSPAMRAAVRSVAKCFPTAIISGRSRDKVHELVGLHELYYAGSHGMDIMGPTRSAHGEQLTVFQPARDFLPMIEEVFRILAEKTKSIAGVKVENHKFCTSVHYRNVDPKNWAMVARCVHDVLKEYPRLRFSHGRKVLDIRPVIDWDKGKAVEFLLDSLGNKISDERIDGWSDDVMTGVKESDGVVAIHIGDDRTDEDAFKVLRGKKKGFGILVSSFPKETEAFYSLRDPAQVMQFLHHLVTWKRGSSMTSN